MVFSRYGTLELVDPKVYETLSLGAEGGMKEAYLERERKKKFD
jgi:hypothetical protein